MPLNLDPILIQKADFDDFRDISKNMDNNRWEVYVRESQVQEMRKFLGDTLYLAMIADWDDTGKVFQTQRFIDLWLGVDYVRTGYDIRFHGLKSAIIYFSYARIVQQNRLNVTRYGNKTLVYDLSEDETIQQDRTRINDARSMALSYQSDAHNFLDEKRSTYPEWEQVAIVRHPKKTAFNFTRVQR